MNSDEGIHHIENGEHTFEPFDTIDSMFTKSIRAIAWIAVGMLITAALILAGRYLF